jgi:hypothetical protein
VTQKSKPPIFSNNLSKLPIALQWLTKQRRWVAWRWVPRTGKNGAENWTAGFLPAAHQGTMIRPSAVNPIADLFPPQQSGYITRESDRDGLAVEVKYPLPAVQRNRHMGPDVAGHCRGFKHLHVISGLGRDRTLHIAVGGVGTEEEKVLRILTEIENALPHGATAPFDPAGKGAQCADASGESDVLIIAG